ncbi:hypothetical protein G6L73_30775 [Agrobacterium rhizogenes]|nr:hypothetical protein [Rhizobium rhizogenes]
MGSAWHPSNPTRGFPLAIPVASFNILLPNGIHPSSGVSRLRLLEANAETGAVFADEFYYEGWAVLPDEEWRQRLNDPVFIAISKSEPIGIMGLVRFRPRKIARRATLGGVYVRGSEPRRSAGWCEGIDDVIMV